MSGPIYDLQAAVVGVLRRDTTLLAMIGGARKPARTFTFDDAPIFGGPPTNEPFPYVTLNLVSATDFDHSDRFGRDVTLDVHVWNFGQSPALAYQIADKVSRIVREIEATGRASSLVLIRHIATRLLVEQDGQTHQVALTFRALLQE